MPTTHAGRITEIVKALDEGRMKPSSLTPHLRKKIVQLYAYENAGATNRQIADLIGVTEWQVTKIRKRLMQKMSWEFEDIDVREIAADCKVKAHYLQGRAIRAGHYEVAWRIQMDLIETLMRLGLVYRAPERLAVASMDVSKGDVRNALKEFFREHGVPSLQGFLGLLQTAVNNGDKGNGQGQRSEPLSITVGSVESDGTDGGSPVCP